MRRTPANVLGTWSDFKFDLTPNLFNGSILNAFRFSYHLAWITRLVGLSGTHG